MTKVMSDLPVLVQTFLTHLLDWLHHSLSELLSISHIWIFMSSGGCLRRQITVVSSIST